MFAQGGAHHLRHLLFEVDFRAARNVLRRNLKAASARGNDGRVAKQLGDGLQIEGGRHHHQAQFFAQVLLTLDAQSQS